MQEEHPTLDMHNNLAPSDPNIFAYDAFISYSHHDGRWVQAELLSRLEAAGLHVCIDFRDFQPGAPTLTEIERAIRSSQRTLLVLSPAYLASQWGEFEALLLQTLDPPNQQRRLIPLLKEPCELPLRIRFLTYLDLSDPSRASQSWPRLINTLTATPTPEPNPTAASATPPPAATTPSPAALRTLRAILAELYPDKISALRVAEDAELPVVMLASQDRPIDNWHAILGEAQKRGRLPQLLQVVAAEYGESERLQAALRSVGA
jgi:hypothetical protein